MSNNASQLNPIHVIGGGLAGSEAAWQIARAGLPVVLHEMRPHRMTEAHRTEGPHTESADYPVRPDP